MEVDNISDLGRIAYGFAVAILKEQAMHPKQCFHCKFCLEAIGDGKGVRLVHEDDCQVNLARHFVEEINRA